MEFLVFAIIAGMFGAMALGYLVLTRVSARRSAGRMRMRGDRAVMLAERYMAQVALARTELGRRHRQLMQMAAQLDLSAQELARLNDMKSKFLSMVVHDVRTPLASIRGFSELLARKMEGEREKAFLGNIVQSTDQLGRLISDLTDLAMIEAGKLTVNPQPFDLRAIADDIVPAMRVRGQEKNVEVIYNEHDSPIYVDGDRFRLSQVLMNLMTNALKFTPQGGTITLRISPEGGTAGVYVKDSGIGIHPSEIRKVFEKFYQAKYQKDANLRKQGWGLGLSIATEIINLHKGKIEAASAGLGKGSTFFYRIPMAATPAETSS